MLHTQRISAEKNLPGRMMEILHPADFCRELHGLYRVVATTVTAQILNEGLANYSW